MELMAMGGSIKKKVLDSLAGYIVILYPVLWK